LAKIADTKQIVTKTLAQLSAPDFDKTFPLPLNNKTNTTTFMLLHLAAHLSYHLGQINYHRRGSV
jgi:hypothetical protein